MIPPVLAFADLLESWGLEVDAEWTVREALRQHAQSTTQLNLTDDKWLGMPRRSE